MAMGKRLTEQQGEFWIAATEMPTTPAHPFYKKLNKVLDSHGFDVGPLDHQPQSPADRS